MITGGTGLVGKRLTAHLVSRGYKVIVLSRKAADNKQHESVTYATWDTHRQTINEQALQSADFIINLAGAGVMDRRWTESYKKEIVDSRVKSCSLIAESVKKYPNKVKAIVSASAIGWYGPDKEHARPFTEEDEPSTDFLGQTCASWEKSISEAAGSGYRVCILRTGIVLSNDGGAFAEFIKPLRFGIAAILGNGNQMISWIHIDDLCRLFIYAMENDFMKGTYNAVSTMPVSNRELTLALAKEKKGRFYIPFYVPAFLLKIILGEGSIEVLKSTTVSNTKTTSAGFAFLYPSIESAINELCKKTTGQI